MLLGVRPLARSHPKQCAGPSERVESQQELDLLVLLQEQALLGQFAVQ